MLLVVLLFKGFLMIDRYGFGYVIGLIRNLFYIVLIFRLVEKMWEVIFFEFGEVKGFGKGRERYLEERERIDEMNVIVDNL